MRIKVNEFGQPICPRCGCASFTERRRHFGYKRFVGIGGLFALALFGLFGLVGALVGILIGWLCGIFGIGKTKVVCIACHKKFRV